jgi:GWxTD domain-containing protein
MWRMILITAIIVWAAPLGWADSTLTVHADYASFYLPDQQTQYVELYYSLFRYQLGFVTSDTGQYSYAGVLVTAQVYDSAGRLADSAGTYFLSRIRDKAELADHNARLFDFLPLRMNPGVFRVDIAVVDDVSKATGKTSLRVSVPDYAKLGLAASDLELAYEIQDLTTDPTAYVNPRLVKEGRLVVPNPMGVYQAEIDSVLNVYAELYGLNEIVPGDSGFTLQYVVKDSRGVVVRDFGAARYKKPGSSAVLSNSLDIDLIPPGTYHLVLEAVDLGNGNQTVASRQFAIVDTTAAGEIVSNQDAELMVDIAYYRLSEAEKLQLGSLTPTEKVNLVKQFWRRMDDDPTTPENPIYDEAVQRFQYANEHFSGATSSMDGWKTDRGRVYITYGPFDEETESVMSGKSFPYIKWTYYQLEGGCYFIFVNDFVAGAADYRLVHSTHPREKYDAKWNAVLDDLDLEQIEEP